VLVLDNVVKPSYGIYLLI